MSAPGAKGIQVDREQVVVALGRWRANLQDRMELGRALGLWMLGSIRRTFRDQGSPAGSWPALSPNTIRRDPRKYGSGHKLLIDTARLINSITFQVLGSGAVVIGTNLIYAAVHQFGSRDRGAGEGPQARIPDRAVQVGEHERARLQSARYAQVKIYDKNGQQRTVRMRARGPQNQSRHKVGAHTRFQNIPSRPYVVFRPEDPQKLQGIARAYMAASARNAGLETV